MDLQTWISTMDLPTRIIAAVVATMVVYWTLILIAEILAWFLDPESKPIIKRSLSQKEQEEIDNKLKRYINDIKTGNTFGYTIYDSKAGHDTIITPYDLARKMINSGASKELVDLLVHACASGKAHRFALETAKKYDGATKQTIEWLITQCVNDGEVELAKEAAKLAGRNLTHREIDSLIRTNINKGLLYSAAEAAKLGGRNLTPEEVDTVVKNQFVYKTYVVVALIDAVHYAEFGASKETIEWLIKLCIDNGEVELAVRAAKLAGRNLREGETDLLVKNMLDRTDLRSAQSYIKPLGRRLTAKEINYFIENDIKKNRVGHILTEIEYGSRAFKRTISENISRENIECLIDFCVKGGSDKDARMLAKLAKRKLTQTERDCLKAKQTKRKFTKEEINTFTDIGTVVLYFLLWGGPIILRINPFDYLRPFMVPLSWNPVYIVALLFECFLIAVFFLFGPLMLGNLVKGLLYSKMENRDIAANKPQERIKEPDFQTANSKIPDASTEPAPASFEMYRA